MATAVVTGAAGGIGRALTRRLAAAGHQVHTADIADTADLAAEVGGLAHAVDVSRPEDMERLAAAAGDAEVVCLNAGVVGTSLGAPWEVPAEEWQHLLGINLLGVVNGLRAFVPAMVARERPGRIVVTASLAGLVTFPGGGAYAATKHALVAVAEQAALALRDTPVSVTLLCPALVRSGMSETGEDPDVVAAQALAAAEEGRFLVVPPEWEAALVSRAERLVTGTPPELPAPGSAGAAGPVRGSAVRQMRVVVEAADYDEAVRFYRDALGGTTELQIHGETGEKVTILDVGRATLELSNPAQVDMIDRVEVGHRVSPHVRVAFEVADAAATTETLVDAGARLVAPPTRTPWDSLNARLEGPAGLQLTLFEELADGA